MFNEKKLVFVRAPYSQRPHVSDEHRESQRLRSAVNRLAFDKTERTQARHLKKALQLPTAAESCCSPLTIRKLDIAIHAIRRKGATGPDDIPPTILKALGPMAKAELLSIFNESFSKGVVP